jgi:hypothetical protein
MKRRAFISRLAGAAAAWPLAARAQKPPLMCALVGRSRAKKADQPASATRAVRAGGPILLASMQQ